MNAQEESELQKTQLRNSIAKKRRFYLDCHACFPTHFFARGGSVYVVLVAVSMCEGHLLVKRLRLAN